MTPQEFLIKFGKEQYKKHEEDISLEVFNDPDLRFVIDAMEAYGKQEYNQAIDDLIEGDVILDKAQTIKKFKKL